tara:strand:+ start:233492 stop:234562 length:1071 start_codon:yes stop_codon:yes gene_type:complete
MTLLIFYLMLAIGVSFICSISEAVMLSLRPSYITMLEQKNAQKAALLKKLSGNLDRPLAAILTANTIAHTVGAAGVGAQAAVVFGNEYLGLTSAVLTLLILIFSEIIPKTIGATYWQALAPTFGVLVNWMTVGLLPLVWLSERVTRLISRSDTSVFTFSRDEMKAMVKIGEQEGLLDPKESKIVSNLMKLHKISIESIMTPRSVIYSASADLTVKGFFEQHANSPFSRIPIYTTDQDEMVGYVLKTDILLEQAKDNFDANIIDYKRDCIMLPDSLTAFHAYERMMHEKSHIALVVDEYGTVRGLLSLEDIVETIIGLEITDEMDAVEDMQALAHKRWRERMIAIGLDPDTLSRDKK